MSNSIRNIIFDFGGVIINISHSNLENEFKSLGVLNFDNLFSQAGQIELFQKFETGAISANEFRYQAKKLTNLDFDDDQFDQTWNTIIGDFPVSRIRLLERINKKYNIFLFSNTNIIHYKFYTEKFKREFGYDLSSLFKNTFWSFVMGKRKPNPNSFLEIIDKEKIIPADTLFIDDSYQNIEAANKLNLKTFHLQNSMDVTELFDNRYLLKKI